MENLFGFYKCRLAGSGFVMNKSLHLTFVLRENGNTQPPLPNGDASLCRPTVGLCRFIDSFRSEDTDYFTSAFEFQIPNFVINMENLFGFYKCRLAGSGFVMNKSLHLTFVLRENGNTQPPLPNGDASLCRPTVGLCRFIDSFQ